MNLVNTLRTVGLQKSRKTGRTGLDASAIRWATVILLLAAALRLIGIAWGYPDPQYSRSATAASRTSAQVIVHPDEFALATRAYLMVATRDVNPHFFENPSFFINLNVLLHFLSGDSAHYPPIDPKVDMREIGPFTVYPMGRAVSALMSLLGVAFVYGIGRRLFDVKTAALAALLMAVSFPDVQHAHYATTNVTAGAMLCGSIWASLRLLQSHARLRDYILAGLFVGLAGSTKYNVGIVGITYALCGLVAVRRDRSVWRLYLWGFVAVGVGFFVGTPFALFDPKRFLHDFLFITSQYTQGQGYPETSGAFPLYLLYLIWFGLGVIASLLMIPGVWSALRHARTTTRRGTLIILAFLIVYALIILQGRRLGDHLVLPIVGPCAVLAAAGTIWLYQRLRLSRLLIVVGIGLLMVQPLAYAVYFDRLLTTPDTRELAQAWIYSHIPAGAHIHLTGSYNVPLDAADYTTSQTFWSDGRPLQSIKEAQGASVLVVSDTIRFLFNSANYWIPAGYAEQQNTFENRLTGGLQEIARFERPRWPGDDMMITTASYFHDPTITIYCLTASCTQ